MEIHWPVKEYGSSSKRGQGRDGLTLIWWVEGSIDGAVRLKWIVNFHRSIDGRENCVRWTRGRLNWLRGKRRAT
jgi:hypothetical protein